MSYTGAPQPPRAVAPPFQRKIRKVGAPLALIIVLGTVTGLIVIALTAANPVGTAIGFALSSVAMTIVVLAYVWLDRWEPEPPRLLVLAFLWGTSVAVVISTVLQLTLEAAINPGQTETVSPISIVLGAPLTEEAAKGLFLLLMMTGRRRNELNSMTDCLVYAGLVGAGFAWLEDILYIGGGESVSESLATAALRLIMAPFAHSLFTTMFGIGVYFALQQRNAAAKAGCILLGYAGAVIMHGLWNGSSLLSVEAYFLTYIFWMVPVFALAIVARCPEPPPGAASRRRQAARHGGGGRGDPERGDLAGLDPQPEGGDRPGDPDSAGSPRPSRSRTSPAQVVELAFVRDRIDRGFGDQRVSALLNEEAQAVYAARAAAPALQSLAGYRAP